MSRTKKMIASLMVMLFTCTAFAFTSSAALIASYDFETDQDKQLVDNSGENNHATFFDGEEVGVTYVDGKFGKALELDGATQYFEVNNKVFDTEEITLAFWVKWEGGAPYQRFFEMGTAETGEHWMIVPYTTDKKFQFSAYNKSEGGAFIANLSKKWDVPKGEWVHMAVTMDKNNLTRLYINGEVQKLTVEISKNEKKSVQKGVTEFTSPVSFKYVNNPKDITKKDWMFRRFGASATSTWDATTAGTYDSIKIFNEALTAEQVVELKDTNKVTLAGKTDNANSSGTTQTPPDTSAGTGATTPSTTTPSKTNTNEPQSTDGASQPSKNEPASSGTEPGTTSNENTSASQPADNTEQSSQGEPTTTQDTPDSSSGEDSAESKTADSTSQYPGNDSESTPASAEQKPAESNAAEENKGMPAGAVAGIVIACVVIIGGGIALYIFRDRIFKKQR